MHRFHSRTIVRAVVVGLALSVVTLPQPAHAAGDPVLAEGTVLRDGAPDPTAQVVAAIWPNETVLNGLGDGTAVTTLDVSPVAVQSNGQFSVRLHPNAVPADYRSPEQTIDLEIRVIRGTETTTWHETVGIPGCVGSLCVASWPSLQHSGPMTLDFEIGTAATVTDRLNSFATFENENGDAEGGSGAMPVEKILAGGPVCFWSWITSSSLKTGQPEHWVNAYGWSGAKVTVSNKTSSSHTMGIAFSGSAAGYFKLQGSSTKTVTSGAANTVPGFTNMAIYNRVNYRYYYFKNNCSGSISARQWKPIGFFSTISPTYNKPIGHVNYAYCERASIGQTYTKSTGNNVTYSTGIELIGVYKASGVNVKLSADANYSSYTSLTWKPTANSWYCGSDAVGPDSSPKVEMHQR